MGTLGDNLLKLTEFPFSYSLIGLLALIFGEGLSPGEDPLIRLGPLLILMGLVATVLSITDPIGALQKRWLSVKRSISYPNPSLLSRFKSEIISGLNPLDWFRIYYVPSDYPEMPLGTRREDGTEKTNEEIEADKRKYQRDLLSFIERQQIFFDSAFGIRWTVLVCLLRNFQDIINKNAFQRALQKLSKYTAPWLVTPILDELFSNDDALDLQNKINSMRDQTLRTTWIVREIDKITAMAYFAIIISIFISAEFLMGGFLDRFIVSFQGGDQTKDEGQNATASTNGATSSTIVGAGLVARIIIIAFSFAALGAVLYMLYRRHSELNYKAWTTFKFLVALDATKIENERFNPSLKDIERYLSNGDWTMADYWVQRVMDEYDKLIRDQAVKGKDKGKKK
jgi:hypothetical protein